MSTILSEVLSANEEYAAGFGDRASLALPPARGFAILTCMDARLDPARYAGLAEGDAHIIRNAGGRASDDAIRSLVISHRHGATPGDIRRVPAAARSRVAPSRASDPQRCCVQRPRPVHAAGTVPALRPLPRGFVAPRNVAARPRWRHLGPASGSSSATARSPASVPVGDGGAWTTYDSLVVAPVEP